MINSYLNAIDTSPKKPIVSIVCVTFNAEKTLPLLLASVAAKKNDAIELIIIDGQSTDGTVALFKEFEHTIDFWLSEPDEGIYDAMNKSLHYANGDWIIFLGADDLLGDDFISCVQSLKDRNTVYYGNVKYRGRLRNKVYDDYYFTKLNICHQTIFYPKKVFAKYTYDVNYIVYADHVLNMQCWRDRELSFVHLDYMVSVFKYGGFSTTTKDNLFDLHRDKLFKKYLKPQSYYRYVNRTKGFLEVLKRLVLFS